MLDNGSFGTRTVKFESGLLARQAAGSVTAYLDDETMLLSATTAGKHPKDHFDFFPLTIDVEERMYAVGQIPGSFFRREGRPGEDAILTCRLIDRPLRPTFKKGLRNEVQVVITVLALDPDSPYDVLAINAASMSTQLSGLPFSGPVGGVRVALIDGQWVAFPSHSQLERAVFDMVVAGRVTDTGDVAIMMVEAEATEQTWELVRVRRAGARPRRSWPAASTPPSRSSSSSSRPRSSWPSRPPSRSRTSRSSSTTRTTCTTPSSRPLRPTSPRRSPSPASRSASPSSDERQGRRARASSPATSRAARRSSAPRSAPLTKKLVRERVLRDKVRIDGRGLTDIRTLSAEVGVIPRVHGSALFERGETQILGVTTLNMLTLEQKLDTLSPEKTRRYMHKYVFPPYSTGETGRVGSPKRREVGHGALARRALLPVLPDARGVPLRDPPALRGHGLQRLHLDGLGLRLDPVAAAGRCAAAGARRRHRDGSHLR